MKRFNGVCVLFVVGAVIVGSYAACLFAEEEKPKVSPSVAQAIKHVAELEMRLADGNQNGKSDRDAGERLKVSERPVLTFGDAARGHEAGTLWFWSNGGRPVAMMELYRAIDENAPWVQAWTLTSPRLVQMKSPRDEIWKPAKADFAPQAVPNEPPVGDKPALRLRQMKDLARKFAAHEFWDPNNSRFELRLLETPVHRYSDAANKVLDGAVFVFAHGTNPEILLFLEANGDQPDQAQWQFACFRLGSAELHVELDGGKVWSRDRTPGVIGTPRDPYWLLITQRQGN